MDGSLQMQHEKKSDPASQDTYQYVIYYVLRYSETANSDDAPERTRDLKTYPTA